MFPPTMLGVRVAIFGAMASVCTAVILSSAPAQAVDNSIKVLSVLPLDVRDARIDQQSRTAFEESIRTIAGNELSGEGYTVLTGETTLSYLEDNGIDPVKVCDASCALKAAREMKVSLFVSGSIASSEGQYIAFVRLFEVKTGHQMGAVELEGETVRDLRRQLKEKAGQLFQRVRPEPVVAAPTSPPAAPSVSSPPAVPVTTPSEETGPPVPPERRVASPGPGEPGNTAPGEIPESAESRKKPPLPSGMSIQEYAASVTAATRAGQPIGDSLARLRRASAIQTVGLLVGCVANLYYSTHSTKKECLTDLHVLDSETAPTACAGPFGPLLDCRIHPGYTCWSGPYIPQVKKDPWGHEFQATFDEKAKMVSVSSAGPDGQFGTDDDVSSVMKLL